tara:strand:- start:683 stop:823 length:141 start_codon:yes stop_codon:yes gene_type:complete
MDSQMDLGAYPEITVPISLTPISEIMTAMGSVTFVMTTMMAMECLT